MKAKVIRNKNWTWFETPAGPFDKEFIEIDQFNWKFGWFYLMRWYQIRTTYFSNKSALGTKIIAEIKITWWCQRTYRETKFILEPGTGGLPTGSGFIQFKQPVCSGSGTTCNAFALFIDHGFSSHFIGPVAWTYLLGAVRSMTWEHQFPDL